MKKNLNVILNKNKALKNKQFTFFKLLQEGTLRREKQKELKLKLNVKGNFLLKAFNRKVDKAYFVSNTAVDLSKTLNYNLLSIKLRQYAGESEKKVAFEKGLDLQRLWTTDAFWFPSYTWKELVKTIKTTKYSMEPLEYKPYLKTLDVAATTNEDGNEEEDSNKIDTNVGESFSAADKRVHELSIFTFAGDLKKMQKKVTKKLEEHVILETYSFLNKYDIRYEIEVAHDFIEFDLANYFNDYAVKFKGVADEDINLELELQKSMINEFKQTGLLLFGQKPITVSLGINFSEISKRSVMNTPSFFESNAILKFKKNKNDLLFNMSEEKNIKLIEQINLITGQGAYAFNTYKQRILNVNKKLYQDALWIANNYKRNLSEEHNFKFYQYKQLFDYIGIVLIFMLFKGLISLLESTKLIAPRDINIFLIFSNYKDMFCEFINNEKVFLEANYLEKHINNLLTPNIINYLQFKNKNTSFLTSITNEFYDIWKLIPITQNIQESVYSYMNKYIICSESIYNLGINLLDTFC